MSVEELFNIGARHHEMGELWCCLGLIGVSSLILIGGLVISVILNKKGDKKK